MITIKRTGRNNIQVKSKNFPLTSRGNAVLSSRINNGQKSQYLALEKYMTEREKREYITTLN